MDEKVMTALSKADACPTGLKFAAQYATPQDAWDAIREPSHLLWVLCRFHWRNSSEDIVKPAKKWAATDSAIRAAKYTMATANITFDTIFDTTVSAAVHVAHCAASAAAAAAGGGDNYEAIYKKAAAAHCNDIRELFPNPPEIY